MPHFPLAGDCRRMTKDDRQPQQRHMSEMSAVASAEPFAAFAPFRWHYGSVPPTQNVNSAVTREAAARQFSGCVAICAVFAAFSAHFAL